MKLKSVVLTCGLFLVGPTFAGTVHSHPSDPGTAAESINRPAYCQVEVINNSGTDVSVTGTYSDGYRVNFMIYRYEGAHYIDMFYNGICHPSVYVTVQSPYATYYSGYTHSNTSLIVYPEFGNKIAVERKSK